MLQHAQRQFLGQAHTKLTKKESVIMGHLWFHTFHLPLCVTVINILLTQNTRLHWFTWTNYMYCTAQVFPYLQDTLSLLLSLCFLTVPHLPTHNIAKVFFFFLFYPAGSQALTNPIPLSNSEQTPFPTQTSRPSGTLLALSLLLPHPGSHSVSHWNCSSLSL